MCQGQAVLGTEPRVGQEEPGTRNPAVRESAHVRKAQCVCCHQHVPTQPLPPSSLMATSILCVGGGSVNSLSVNVPAVYIACVFMRNVFQNLIKGFF